MPDERRRAAYERRRAELVAHPGGGGSGLELVEADDDLCAAEPPDPDWLRAMHRQHPEGLLRAAELQPNQLIQPHASLDVLLVRAVEHHDDGTITVAGVRRAPGGKPQPTQLACHARQLLNVLADDWPCAVAEQQERPATP